MTIEEIKEPTKEEKALLTLYDEAIGLENSIEKAQYDKEYEEEVDIDYFIELKQSIDVIIEYINQLETERDYYKKMYLETNNGFIANTEGILKDLEKRYEVYRDKITKEVI